MSRLFSLKKNEIGQSLVEFALVLPILLLLILGVLEYGWLLYGRITLNSAVREGVRASAVVEKSTEVDAKAEEAVNKVLGLGGGSPFKNRQIVGSVNGNNVELIVSTDMDALIGIYVSNNFTMNATAYMRWEGGN